jgi:hypothetical protein
MQLRQADDNLLRSEESHAIIIKELAHTIDDLERKLVLTSMECAVSRLVYEPLYAQLLCCCNTACLVPDLFNQEAANGLLAVQLHARAAAQSLQLL